MRPSCYPMHSLQTRAFVTVLVLVGLLILAIVGEGVVANGLQSRATQSRRQKRFEDTFFLVQHERFLCRELFANSNRLPVFSQYQIQDAAVTSYMYSSSALSSDGLSNVKGVATNSNATLPLKTFIVCRTEYQRQERHFSSLTVFQKLRPKTWVPVRRIDVPKGDQDALQIADLPPSR